MAKDDEAIDNDNDKAEPFCQPADSFCCGCSLDFGCKTILTFHAMSSAFYMAVSVSNVMFDARTIAADIDLFTQVVNCFLALCSVPFILSGISGVKYGVEIHLRIYLYWLIVTFLMDLTFTTWFLVRSDCSDIPAFLQAHGAAVACGSTRIFSVAYVTLVMIMFGYSCFLIWSKCEELQLQGCEANFDVLILAQQRRDGIHVKQDRSGLFGVGLPSRAANPVLYGSTATPAIGGSTALWGNKFHDMEYPPKPKVLIPT